MIRHRYDEMVQANDLGADTRRHAYLDHTFHLAICEASHNPVLVDTLRSLTDLLLGSVFACVNNLYHRQPQKRQIDQQHAKLFEAATQHVNNVRDSLKDIEQEEQRLVRAILRLEGWA